jgi:hypothetical protein
MSDGFACVFDRQGNVTVSEGLVFQPKTGVRRRVAGGGAFSPLSKDRSGAEFSAVVAATAGIFVGGSGRNIISAGLPVPASGPMPPIGFFRPSFPGSWKIGVFTLTVSGPSAAVISDGTDDVAELTSGGTAPVGSYVATAYGETTYNDGDPFTLTVTAEGGSVGIPDARVIISAGSAQAGSYLATDDANYESEDDADWTIVIASDGTAELQYMGDAMATRAAGSLTDPSGLYEANALGMSSYNLTDAEPIDGEPWNAVVDILGKTPRVGWVYLEITETAGTLISVAGPFFASSLPANAGDVYVFPLAYSDGYSIRKEHSGTIIWP